MDTKQVKLGLRFEVWRMKVGRDIADRWGVGSEGKRESERAAGCELSAIRGGKEAQLAGGLPLGPFSDLSWCPDSWRELGKRH